MPSEDPLDITGMLAAWSEGDEEALASVMPLVYDDLRLIARRRLGRSPVPTVSQAHWRMRLISSWSTRAALDATTGPTSSRCVHR